MNDFNRDEMKEAFKEAAKEYIGEVVKQFGWFSLRTLAVAAIAGIIYLALLANGWHK